MHSLTLNFRSISCLFFVCVLAGDSQAQLFSRLRGSFQACPTGGCQTTSVNTGHWSYPGSIDSHLLSSPVVSGAGMSMSQKLTLRDSLHTGAYRAAAPIITYQSAPVVAYQSAPIITYRHVPTVAAPAVQVAPPQFVPMTQEFMQAAVREVMAAEGIGFRAELLRALPAARRSGKITAMQSVRIRVAMISPAFSKHAEDLAVTQMVASGEDPDAIPMNADGTVNVASINWEGLTKFIEAFIPLLLTLLQAFGMGGA